MVKINKKGKITQGEHTGWYVLVQDDTNDTGGYYILVSKSRNFDSGLGEAYDNWVETEKQIEDFFNHSNWEIEWLE